MILSNSKTAFIFADQPDQISEIKLADGTPVGSTSRQAILIRTPAAVSEPVLLSRVSSSASGPASAELLFQDESGAWRAELQIHAAEQGLRFRLQAYAPEPIWLVEWRLSGLQFDEVIIPALGGQALSGAMPAETTLSYKYPFWWNAQFVVGKKGGGGLWLFSRDEKPDLKLLRVGRSSDGFAWTYGCEARPPFPCTLEAEWYLDGINGGWEVAVERHQRWLEEAFDLRPLQQKASFPAWAREINFILELWGARRDTIAPMHTFAQMVERLQAWRGMHDPRQTLVYLPGFAMHGIDSHAPDYHPSAQCGGAAEFARLIEAAHSWGFRVMIHTNVLAMTFNHPHFPRFREHQVIDCFGRPQGWGLDMDGDWLAEPYFAYINPGVRAWGDLMVDVIGDLVRRFGIDGVFLDQTLLAFNVSRGPNFIEGMRTHIRRLQEAMPEILFAGEGMHEHLLNPLPMAQIHGIDSITEVHGMEGQLSWRSAHPVSTALFSPYCRFMAHLLTRHPSHPMFTFQESAYAKLHVIPALCLYSAAQAMDLPEVKEMIARAQQLTLSDGFR